MYLILDGTGIASKSSFVAEASLKKIAEDPEHEEYWRDQAQKGYRTFFTMLTPILKHYKPDYTFFCFDGGPIPNPRKTEYPLYKANRPRNPHRLAYLTFLKEYLRDLDVPFIEWNEADDLMYSLAQEYHPCLVYTFDGDMAQIVDDFRGIQLLKHQYDRENSRKSFSLTTEEDVAKYGGPAGVVGYKALAGDAGDNIPGIDGIGKKGALELLAEFGDITALYTYLNGPRDNPEREKLLKKRKKDLALTTKLGKERELPDGTKLQMRGIDQARLCWKLAKLRKVDISEIDQEDFRTPSLDLIRGLAEGFRVPRLELE